MEYLLNLIVPVIQIMVVWAALVRVSSLLRLGPPVLWNVRWEGSSSLQVCATFSNRGI